MSWQLMSNTQTWLEMRDNLNNQKRMQKTVEAQYQTELDRMKALGFDIKLIQSSLKTFKSLEADGIHPLPLFKAIGQSLGPELRLDKVVMRRKGNSTLGLPAPDPALASSPPNPATAPSSLEAILTLSFPPTLDPEVGVKQVNDLSRRISTALPQGYNVAVSKQVADLIYTENTAGEAGTAKDKDAKKEDYKAEITIKGPLQ